MCLSSVRASSGGDGDDGGGMTAVIITAGESKINRSRLILVSNSAPTLDNRARY